MVDQVLIEIAMSILCDKDMIFEKKNKQTNKKKQKPLRVDWEYYINIMG